MLYKGLIFIMLVAAFCVSFAAAATVGSTLNYQGKLTDAAGNPLTGSYSVTFKLYDVASAGTALSTDTHSVTTNNGLFTTTIAVDPSVVDGRALWVGITVGTDAEMTPRQVIRPVPYALNLAGNAPTEPLRYEYYTGKMNGYDVSSQLWILTDVTNMGDSAANVCVIEYGQHSQLSAWKEFKNHCYSLNPHWSKTDTPTVVTNVSYSRFVKITSDSPFVAPQARFFDSYISASQPSYEYLPGDFRKVEIYN
jgi:hypothetical protein